MVHVRHKHDKSASKHLGIWCMGCHTADDVWFLLLLQPANLSGCCSCYNTDIIQCSNTYVNSYVRLVYCMSYEHKQWQYFQHQCAIEVAFTTCSAMWSLISHGSCVPIQPEQLVKPSRTNIIGSHTSAWLSYISSCIDCACHTMLSKPKRCSS